MFLKSDKGFNVKLIILLSILAIAFILSFLVGRYDLSVGLIWDILVAQLGKIPVLDKIIDYVPYWASTLETVVVQVRLPRIMCCILVGGALSVSGASYQTLFKNPMVSPDLLGVSAGAGFGAALCMLNDGSWWQIQLAAFAFGLLAVTAAYSIGKLFGHSNITVLVLAGVVVSSVFQSLLSIIKTMADTENTLPSITFWLMGSMGRADIKDLGVMLLISIFSLLMIFLFRHQINTLAAGENEALTMGVNVPRVKLIVVATSTLLTVCSVSICGIVGWIGMVVPHIARILVGANYSKLVPISFAIGGVFLLLIDNMIRGPIGVDLPLGVLTSLIGTPVFVVLLTRARRVW